MTLPPNPPLSDEPRTSEPVIVAHAVQGALVAIWGVVIIAVQVDSMLAGAVTVALGAVVNAVVAAVLRGKVTPT
jgi:hypothetical protein